MHGNEHLEKGGYSDMVTERRLRVSHVVVQPVLVWDDGEELSPGPTVEPLTMRISELAEFAANLPGQVAAQGDHLQSTPAACSDSHTAGEIISS